MHAQTHTYRPTRFPGNLIPCLRSVLLAATIAILSALPVMAQSAVYKLGTQDKVRIRVFEWRAPIDKFFEWEALNGEFVVGQAGTISLPLIGEIHATGRSTSELGETIGREMIQQIGLSFAPKVAVEISEYRPFYIVGSVATPGAYPYQPELTVLRALSIAGGLPRPDALRFNRLDREVITGRGAISQLTQKVNELQARKARLSAEIEGLQTISFPQDLIGNKDRPDIARIVEQEERIFETRRTALERQITTLNRLKSFLSEEIKSLTEQVELKKGEVQSVSQEVANVETLVQKGLSPTTRLSNLERVVSQLSSERLRIETALLRARQESSRAEVDIEAAQNKNILEATNQLRETEVELEDALVQLNTQKSLLFESEVGFPSLLSSQRKNAEESRITYTIVRKTNDQQEEIPATELSDVLPGDTVKVEIPLPDFQTGLGSAKRGVTQ